jgi:hypothetical protein
VKNLCLELDRSTFATLVCVFTIAFLLAACGGPQPQAPPVDTDIVSATPPFLTKEPQRYQARRTTTFTQTSGVTSVNETRTTTVQIMRDGEQRREDHEGSSIGSIVFLEGPSGRFVLLPHAKLFADLGEEISNSTDPKETELADDEVSPDLMLHESALASRYQKLGVETIAGRATTKYRVTPAEPVNPATSETLIWIDEALGMPIKSVSTSKSSDRTTLESMELQDIRTEVDVKVFSLPADYRKVAASVIFGMIRQAANRAKLPLGQK